MYRRAFWLIVGTTATGCGIAGVVLPLVPTTPFLVVAAYAFTRASPRLHAWLHAHPCLGRLLKNWQRHRSIDSGTKATATLTMAVTLAASWLLGIPYPVLAAQAAVLAAAALFVLTRPSTPEE